MHWNKRIIHRKRSVCDINSSVWEAGTLPQTDEVAFEFWVRSPVSHLTLLGNRPRSPGGFCRKYYDHAETKTKHNEKPVDARHNLRSAVQTRNPPTDPPHAPVIGAGSLQMRRIASTGFSLCLVFVSMWTCVVHAESTLAPRRLPEGQMTDWASNSRGTPSVWGKVQPPKQTGFISHKHFSFLV